MTRANEWKRNLEVVAIASTVVLVGASASAQFTPPPPAPPGTVAPPAAAPPYQPPPQPAPVAPAPVAPAPAPVAAPAVPVAPAAAPPVLSDEDGSNQSGFAWSIAHQLYAVQLGTLGVTGNLGTRLGWYNSKLMLFGCLDYQSAALKVDQSANTLSLFTLGAGARYAFSDSRKGAARPYIIGNLFTVIPSSSVDGDPAFNDTVSSASSIGALLGFGAEYMFSTHFALGAEAGVTVLSASADEGRSGTATTQVKAQVNRMYSSLHLNFYL